MKKIKFIIEKTSTGYSAYAEDFDKYPVGTVGDTIEDIKINMLDALNTWLEYKEMQKMTSDQIEVRLDLPQVFEYFKELNAKSLSKRIGMNESLLYQYISGLKSPSKKQTERILEGIRSLAAELSGLTIA